jgi:tripeptidyl-peptidase-2
VLYTSHVDGFSHCGKERDEVKDKKTILVEALVRMALAYAAMKSDDASAKFDDTLKRLKAWADIESYTKYATLLLERETRAGRYGSALKLLNKLISKDGNNNNNKDWIRPLEKSALLAKRAEIYEKLGYSILVEYDKRMRVIACPKSFALF